MGRARMHDRNSLTAVTRDKQLRTIARAQLPASVARRPRQQRLGVKDGLQEGADIFMRHGYPIRVSYSYSLDERVPELLLAILRQHVERHPLRLEGPRLHKFIAFRFIDGGVRAHGQVDGKKRMRN